MLSKEKKLILNKERKGNKTKTKSRKSRDNNKSVYKQTYTTYNKHQNTKKKRKVSYSIPMKTVGTLK